MNRLYNNKANPCSIQFPTEKFKCTTNIAILMATFNGEKHLASQLNSILNQNCKDWTLYIRDDGSLDSTIEILKEFQRKYPLKIILIEDTNLHIGFSNNFYELLFSVDANYYMFCDQDDVWTTDKLSISYNKIINLTNHYPSSALIVGCDSYICNEDLSIINFSIWKTKKINRNRTLDFNHCAVQCPLGGAEMIFNKIAKSLLYKNIDNDFTYDHWLLLNVIKNGKVFLIEDSLRYYRIHTNNVIGAKLLSKSNKYRHPYTFIKKKFIHYYNDFLILKQINYGSILKYIYYKIDCIRIYKLF